MHRSLVLLLILLAGCAAYDPPVTGDRASTKFQADLVRCRKQASTAASRRANATPQSAAMAVFDAGDRQRQDLTTCMQGRGYAPRSPNVTPAG
jgi:hypothetical protein